MGNLVSHKKKLLKPHHLKSQPLSLENNNASIKPILRPTNSFSMCESKKHMPQSVSFIDEKIMSENKFKQPSQKHIDKVISPFYINASPKLKRRCRSFSNPAPLDYYLNKVQHRRRRTRSLQRANSCVQDIGNSNNEPVQYVNTNSVGLDHLPHDYVFDKTREIRLHQQ